MKEKGALREQDSRNVNVTSTDCIALPPHTLYTTVELLGTAEISHFSLDFDWSCFSVRLLQKDSTADWIVRVKTAGT
jgi:hypothetical protein